MPTKGPPLFAVGAFWAFVLGGLVFGAIFMSNWQALGQRGEEPRILVGAGPITVTMRPVSISQPAPPAPTTRSPQAPITSGLANVVRNVLPEWSGKDRVNIVLLGIDKRDDEPAEGTRSDTIMIASFDPVTKSAALVSLPRDMWVSIPNYGQQRINVAHAVGGPELTMRTITANFAIPIQYYARVDFRGFEQLVDTVGGVMIDVDRPVKDDEYPTEDYGYQRIYFAPGAQLMDGRRALQYARSRHGTNDFSRSRRQQQVLISLRERALQLNMLSKAPDMVGVVQKSLATNLSPVQLLSLARLISEVEQDRIDNLVIDVSYVRPFTGSGGEDLLLPDTPRIRQAIDNTFKLAAHPELRARVEVLNGSGTAGLGQKAADYLTARGFNVVKIAPAERNDYRSSLVQVLTADRRAAEALATTLRMPVSAITDLPTPNALADVRIVVGQDFRLPTTTPSADAPTGAGG
ncbi:MAG TPA: LCP family protein [Chloroflexota bacterium]|nr:LCP family protein [Chloroflexota bacterium]